MRNILIISLIFIVACSKDNRKDFFYLYYKYEVSKDAPVKESSAYYVGRKIVFINDSLLITSYVLDEKLNASSICSYKFVRDGDKLFRISKQGQKHLFFTIENSNNVFYPIVLYDQVNNPDTVYGSNYRYISKVELIDSKNNKVSLYKFFVRYLKCKNDDRSIVGEDDYYCYYTEDFVLFKQEYVGILNSAFNTERLNVEFPISDSLTNRLKCCTFGID